MSYQWNFEWVWNNTDVLFKGLLVTFQLTIASFLIGYLIALFFFYLKTSKNKLFKWIAIVVIEITRDIPLLVLLVWLYFALPIFLPSLKISAFWLSVVGLSFNFAGFQAEIIRAGFQAIPRNQIDVAKSFGFSRVQIFTSIILPQSFWRSIAPTIGQLINTLKLTSLASFITVPELFYTTSALIQDTFRPLEFYTAMAVLYLIIIFPISISMQILEKRLSNKYNG